MIATVSRRLALFALAVALLAPAARAQEGMPSQADMADFMKAMNTMMSAASNQAAVVDFRELKALLPASVPGLKRTSASGEKSGAMGMTVSYAEASYEAEEGGEVGIKITDNAGIGGFMAMAQAGWSAMEMDRETDTGFERTTMYGNCKAKEEYDNEDQSGAIEVMVAGRFMVEVTGNGVPFEKMQAAVRQIDLAKLASLKPAP
ncbi:MAG: hypothetical protein JXB04_01940 [Kiritimatiellae bacterium]|nr:hypothetical protein [Kiritimatiellia bacterium]